MLRMYSVYDSEKEMYSNPIFIPQHSDPDKADIDAVRSFKAQLYDRRNLIAMFPDKYELRYLGKFDECEGLFIFDDEMNLLVITGLDAIKELQNESEKN